MQPVLYGTCAGFMGMFLIYETLPNLVKVPFYVCIFNSSLMHISYFLIIYRYNSANIFIHSSGSSSQVLSCAIFDLARAGRCGEPGVDGC